VYGTALGQRGDHNERVFRLSRATASVRGRLLALAQAAPSGPDLMTVADGLVSKIPTGFVRDVSRSEIGRGRPAFAVAREALQRWAQFDLGWVKIAEPRPPLAPGTVVAVEARTGGLWSTNVCRVTDVVDEPTRFGFLYSTTMVHVADGQERFVVEWEKATDALVYVIEAVSRPRHPLMRIGYPLARRMQRRFARDSHARMRRLVEGVTGDASPGGADRTG
jgi:uncharacterized protein (UPF0548 family)